MFVIVRLTNTSKDAESRSSPANIFTTGGIDYYVEHFPNQPPSLPFRALLSGTEGDLLPATVINWAKDRFGDNDLDQIAADFAPQDDVWTRAFLAGETFFLERAHSEQTPPNIKVFMGSHHPPNVTRGSGGCRATHDLDLHKSNICRRTKWPLCN